MDIDLFSKNLQAQIEAGVNGIVLAGTLGESSALTLEEKETLLKTTLDVAGSKLPIVLNIAEGATVEAVKQAELADKWGAKGLMLLPPMRYKSDHRETVTYFKTVAEATDLPIMAGDRFTNILYHSCRPDRLCGEDHVDEKDR